jgi:antibiotic biosynthesis monooxygenase (ABM) superfamily enzyme
MLSEESEVTSVVNRHVKPGHEKEYAEWFGRMLSTIKQFRGYRGVTSVVPGGADSDARIILYRFADKASMDNWENSPERSKLTSEVEKYASQSYVKATGLETWFQLPDTHSFVPPPRWKMTIIVFLAASATSFVSKLVLGSYLADWSLVETSLLYSAILVVSLIF